MILMRILSHPEVVSGRMTFVDRVSYKSMMAKKTRGGRMSAAKKRAAKKPGGKGTVKKRSAGKRIMTT